MATYSGTPATATDGQTVSASFWNAEVRDPLLALTGAWTTWTPTVTQSGTVTYTGTYAKYIRVGGFLVCRALLDVTGTGTASNDILCTLPVDMAYATSSYLILGAGWIRDDSTGNDYPCLPVPSGVANRVAFKRSDADHTANVGNDPDFALASGDKISFFVVVEAA